MLAFKKNFKDSTEKFAKIKSAEYQAKLLLIGLRNGTIHIFRFDEVPLLDSDAKIDGEFLSLL